MMTSLIALTSVEIVQQSTHFWKETAVLMGDWLYMSAFETSLTERSLPILDIPFNRVTR